MFSQVCVKNSVHGGGGGGLYPTMQWAGRGDFCSGSRVGSCTPSWADTWMALRAVFLPNFSVSVNMVRQF